MFLLITTSLIAISGFLITPELTPNLIGLRLQPGLKNFGAFTILRIKTSTKNHKKKAIKEASVQIAPKIIDQTEHFGYIRIDSAYLTILRRLLFYDFKVVTIGLQVAFDVKSEMQGFNQHK